MHICVCALRLQRESKLKFRGRVLSWWLFAPSHGHVCRLHPRPPVAKGSRSEQEKSINKPKNKIKHNIPIAILHKCMPSRVENRFQLGPEPKEQSESACDSNCGMLKALAICERSRREKSSRTCMMRRLIGFRNACGLLIFD